jgi:predicted ABC-type ATPase
MAPPILYVVAGPNGSGKTSFALAELAFQAIPFINADIEAQRLSPGSPVKAALAAGRATLSNIAHEISRRNVFALETTLAGLSALETMRRAIGAGYLIDFTYICLSSPELNVGRVAKRVLAGGHHVPDRDVERRYHRSLMNLPAALLLAERARVFDNSTGAAPRLVFEMREQSILFLRQELPDWFKITFQIGSSVEDTTQHVTGFLKDLRQPRR